MGIGLSEKPYTLLKVTIVDRGDQPAGELILRKLSPCTADPGSWPCFCPPFFISGGYGGLALASTQLQKWNKVGLDHKEESILVGDVDIHEWAAR